MNLNVPHPAKIEHAADHEIAIFILGPGYGECILLHVGSRNWIIVDSCLDQSGNPAALTVLQEMGVNPATDVSVVLATHWHDDHIRGLSKVYEHCSGARLAMGSVMGKKKFLAFLETRSDPSLTSMGSGASEIRACLGHARDKERKITRVQERTEVASWNSNDLDHRKTVQLLALSPTGQQLDNFIARVYEEGARSSRSSPARREYRHKKRISWPRENELSIAAVLNFGDSSMLLGADLEVYKSQAKGWPAVVETFGDGFKKSSAFKVPHHGSEGAHLDEIWSRLLVEKPVSVITPWRLAGRNLPRPSDLTRISGMSGATYITSHIAFRAPVAAKFDEQGSLALDPSSYATSSRRDGCVRVLFDGRIGGRARPCVSTFGAATEFPHRSEDNS